MIERKTEIYENENWLIKYNCENKWVLKPKFDNY